MIQIEFTEADIEQLHREHLHHPHARVRQRIGGLLTYVLLGATSSPDLVAVVSQNEIGKSAMPAQSESACPY